MKKNPEPFIDGIEVPRRVPALHAERRRRQLLVLLPLFALPAAWARSQTNGGFVEVWKSPTCGCCEDWVAHLESNGFKMRTHDAGNTDARQRLEMPPRYGACHSASIAGYAIEGHVPAREIRRLLNERPVAIGLAVQAMPIGSPGMDGLAYGPRKDAYEVLLVAKNGSATTYQRY